MHTVLVSLNRQTIPEKLQHALTFEPDQLSGALLGLARASGAADPTITEVVIVSNRERVDVYAAANEVTRATDLIKKFMSRFHQVSVHKFDRYLVSRSDSDAVEHLFTLLNGEGKGDSHPQARMHVRRAFELALRYHTAGGHLSNLFRSAFSENVIAA